MPQSPWQVCALFGPHSKVDRLLHLVNQTTCGENTRILNICMCSKYLSLSIFITNLVEQYSIYLLLANEIDFAVICSEGSFHGRYASIWTNSLQCLINRCVSNPHLYITCRSILKVRIFDQMDLKYIPRW